MVSVNDYQTLGFVNAADYSFDHHQHHQVEKSF